MSIIVDAAIKQMIHLIKKSKIVKYGRVNCLGYFTCRYYRRVLID